MSFDHT